MSTESEEASSQGAAAESGAAGPDPAPPGAANTLNLAVSVTRQVEISGPKSWEYLSCGIDTLDLGLYVSWGKSWPGLERALVEGKAAAEKTDGILWVHSGENLCLIFAGGKPPMYGFHLQTADFHLYVARRERPKDFPNIYVSILAKSLWLHGIRSAVERVEQFVAALGGSTSRIQISRVDLCADFVIAGGLSLDCLVASRVAQSLEHSHFQHGDKLETFYIGSAAGAIRARIYDKSKEILRDGLKLWFFEEVWKREVMPDVWRIEFQFRRQALKQFDIDSLGDLLNQASGLWKYLTDGWLSFRLRDDENISRCSTSPWWTAVQEIGEDFGGALKATRDYSKGGKASPAWYVSHAAGCLVGFAARTGIDDFESVLGLFNSEMRKYWRDRDFYERLKVERIKLGFDDSAGKGAA